MLFRFLGLPHGFELFVGNMHDQDELINGVLVTLRSHGISFIQSSTLKPKSPWDTLIEFQTLISQYIRRAWHTIPSQNPQLFKDVGNGPPRLNSLNAKVIQWCIPKDGICILKFFGNIIYRLVVILQLGILIH